jgi:hypothetical protein
MGYLWYPLEIKELLESSQQMFTNNEVNLKIGIIQKLILLF